MFGFRSAGMTSNFAQIHLKNSFVGLSVAISDVDAMQSFRAAHLIHFVGNRVIPTPARRSTQAPIRKCVRASRAAQNSSYMSPAAVTDVGRIALYSGDAGGLLEHSSYRMFSFFSIGRRVVLIFFLSAAVPLNVF